MPVQARRRVKEKVDPEPSSLVTDTVPPIASTRCLTI
jgi:hypothetical protein